MGGGGLRKGRRGRKGRGPWEGLREERGQIIMSSIASSGFRLQPL
jgi:hypothetical protein